MNIFQYLGLPEKHRIGTNITQLVNHVNEVPDSRKPSGALYLAEIKMDGIFCHVVKKGDDFGFFSRTGLQYTNTHYLEDSAYRVMPDIPDGVYIAELCCEACSLEELSGMYNPNRKNLLSPEQDELIQKSQLWFHDYITLNEFRKGESTIKAADRFAALKNNLPDDSNIIHPILVMPSGFDELANKVIASGYEGAVFKKADETWLAGHKGYKSMKIVKGVSYDLECIDVEEGKGKYKGKIANLIFRWKDGKTVKAMLGKGWSHQDAERLWLEHSNSDRSGPISDIFTVTALQESSKGVLRLPKVGERRFDKVEADV